ncbi:MAG: hypothetical protein HY553_18210, partial [Elusimicrobia bacterium]|nr:hypothetical protein [Elusimicrobiota bacterium]
RALLDDLDPEYSGDPAAYDPDARRDAGVRVREIELTGRLRRPLVSIAGGRDLLVPAASHAEGYARLVERAGATALHSLRVVPHGTHVDSERSRFDGVEPLMPHAHAAFLELATNCKKSKPWGQSPGFTLLAAAR